jgi:hypothetical protein
LRIPRGSTSAFTVRSIRTLGEAPPAAAGSIAFGGVDLRAGDAVRIEDEPGHPVTPAEQAELLVWSFA